MDKKQRRDAVTAWSATFLMLLLAFLAIGGTAFAAETAPESDFTFASGTIRAYNGSATEVIIPASINGVAVKTIDDNAFKDNTTITRVVIPKGVETIMNGVFSGCSNLKSVEIPESVTSIGGVAFFNCSSLESIELPESLETLYSTFRECTGLKSIKIPGGVKAIPINAFLGCSNLEKVELSEGLESIGTQAFYGCSKLESISIPDSVSSIGSWAFRDCSSLKTAKVSGISIDSFAFDGCSNLKTVEFADNVEEIGNSAFRKCTSLESIIFSEKPTLKSIGSSTFSYTALSSISVPSSVKSIGSNAFSSCESLSRVEIAEGVEEIAGSAFSYTGLKEVTIPGTVKSMGSSVFNSCKALETVKILDGLETIENFDFLDCNSLTRIEIPTSVTSIKEKAFGNAYSSTLKLHVYYAGSPAEWKKVSIEGQNGRITEATMHYNDDPAVEDPTPSPEEDPTPASKDPTPVSEKDPTPAPKDPTPIPEKDPTPAPEDPTPVPEKDPTPSPEDPTPAPATPTPSTEDEWKTSGSESNRTYNYSDGKVNLTVTDADMQKYKASPSNIVLDQVQKAASSSIRQRDYRTEEAAATYLQNLFKTVVNAFNKLYADGTFSYTVKDNAYPYTAPQNGKNGSISAELIITYKDDEGWESTSSGKASVTITPMSTSDNDRSKGRSGSSGGSGGGGGSSAGAIAVGTTGGSTLQDQANRPDTPGRWVQGEGGTWRMLDESGVPYFGVWIISGNQWYYLDNNGNMLTGWQLLEGKWYYFETVAGQNQGHLYLSRTTPDGYTVGADGSWQ